MNEYSAAFGIDRRYLAAAGAAACLTLLSLSESATGQTVDQVAIAGDVVLEDRYPERKVRFPNGVSSFPDLVFATAPGYRPLTLDLYVPPGAGADENRLPLVVYVHGGGWMTGHTRHSGAFANWPEALASIANEGFAVASVEYRLGSEAPFPAAFDDVRDAIRWLRANDERFGIDREKAVIMGGSAGGQLAGLVGTACGGSRYPLDSASHSEVSACVQGVVVWYGVFDFSQLVPTAPVASVPNGLGPLGVFLDCMPTWCSEDLVRAASPIDWVDEADPPFLLIHGVADPVVAIDQSRAMHARLQDAGVESTLIEIPAVRHSFIGDTPEATIDASRKAWDASVAFIRRTLLSGQ